MQGDVVELYQNGALIAEYEYDAWGAVFKIKDASGNSILDVAGSTHIASINPIRYRGYYYDVETNLYYLNSRYYNPNIGRFINADGYVSTGQDLNGANMFAYCGNNPVNYYDSEGFYSIPIQNNQMPPPETGYIPPKKAPWQIKHGDGWQDKYGNIWKPDKLHKDHWDVEGKNGGYVNVYPDGSVKGGKGQPPKLPKPQKQKPEPTASAEQPTPANPQPTLKPVTPTKPPVVVPQVSESNTISIFDKITGFLRNIYYFIFGSNESGSFNPSTGDGLFPFNR